MKVVFTETARADLDDMLAFLATNYPTIAASVEERIRAAGGASLSGRRARA